MMEELLAEARILELEREAKMAILLHEIKISAQGKPVIGGTGEWRLALSKDSALRL